MNLAQKKSFEVTTALASTWGRTPGSFRSRVTVTRPTRSSVTLPTRPLVTPETRIGSPSFRPLTLLNTARAVTRLVRSERPVSQNMPATNTTRPSSTIAPTPTSCLYVRSIVALADDGHLQVALEELMHGRVLRLQDLLARAHGADLRLPQQGDTVGDAERAAHVVRQQHALAHAGGAEQRDGAAVVHLEVDAVQHHVVQEPLGEALELDHQPSSSLVITVSRSRMVTHEATTDCVVARPTPSAPCWVLKPREQGMIVTLAAKK